MLTATTKFISVTTRDIYTNQQIDFHKRPYNTHFYLKI